MATDTYYHTIHGLLQKRAEMMVEVEEAHARLAQIRNDVDALDRVLERLGYAGEVQVTPAVPRVVLFYRGELRQFVLGQLRDHGPATTRTLANRLVQLENKDARDRRMMRDIGLRMSKALRQLRDAGTVTGTINGEAREYVWQLAGTPRVKTKLIGGARASRHTTD